MNDYKELIELLFNRNRDNANIMIAAADAIERLVKERDAAIAEICQGCDNCKHRDATIGEPCISCSTYRVGSDFIKSKWEWRGVTDD